MSRSAMLTRNSRKALATALVSGAMFLPLSAPANAAFSCPAGSTLVSGTTCQAVFTSSGTFTMPSGVTTIEALLVGAGGASVEVYGGGGGEVKIVTLATSGDVTVTVGTGAVDSPGGSSSVEQGSTTETANGGGGAKDIGERGGVSGNGNIPLDWGGSGAGAASTDSNGAAGLVVSSLTSTLFKDVSACYGGGGAGSSYGTFSGFTATCGGGSFANFVPNTPVDGGGFNAGTGSVTNTLPAANSGGGGAPLYTFDTVSSYNRDSGKGADGRVVIRFAFDEALADTGANGNGALWFLSAGLGFAGLVLMITGRKTKASN